MDCVLAEEVGVGLEVGELVLGEGGGQEGRREEGEEGGETWWGWS